MAFLDNDGLSYFWGKIKNELDEKIEIADESTEEVEIEQNYMVFKGAVDAGFTGTAEELGAALYEMFLSTQQLDNINGEVI